MRRGFLPTTLRENPHRCADTGASPRRRAKEETRHEVHLFPDHRCHRGLARGTDHEGQRIWRIGNIDGVAGALIGGVVFELLGSLYWTVAQLITATVGAIILIWIGA